MRALGLWFQPVLSRVIWNDGFCDLVLLHGNQSLTLHARTFRHFEKSESEVQVARKGVPGALWRFEATAGTGAASCRANSQKVTGYGKKLTQEPSLL